MFFDKNYTSRWGRDLDQFVNVGLLKGLSLGLIATGGFVVIKKPHSIQQKKW
jgi:hypothetical protein